MTGATEPHRRLGTPRAPNLLARRDLRGQDPQAYKARRPARRAAGEVRASDQPQVRQVSRPDDSAVGARSRGPGDRVAHARPTRSTSEVPALGLAGSSVPTYRPPPLPQSKKSTWTRYDAKVSVVAGGSMRSARLGLGAHAVARDAASRVGGTQEGRDELTMRGPTLSAVELHAAKA